MMNRDVSLFRLACLALFAACIPLSARAATLNVPVQYATIGAAVTAAHTGDTVLVADGTYTGATNRNIDFGGKDLIVQSASGNPAHCVIDCQKGGCAFILQSGETAKSLVAGFTITNGLGFVVDGLHYGGGIYMASGNPVVNNCVFTGNIAIAGDGGGMYGGTATHCVFTGNYASSSGGGMAHGAATNCAFTNNTASGGGGMSDVAAANCVFTGNTAFEYGGGMSGGTATNCVFTGNSAPGRYGLGGGMYSGAATNCVFAGNSSGSSGGLGGGGGMAQGVATNCVFTSNSAVYEGGGVYYGTATNCFFSGNSSAAIGGGMYGGAATNCVITSNKAGSLGGGIAGGAATGCVITGNSASYGGGIAGGAATNCVLFGNTASIGGGGYESGLYFCTVANNSAAQGSGIYLKNNNVTNCIIWGNAATQGAPEVSLHDTLGLPPSVVSHSDVQGGFSGTGNFNADPLFVNQSAGNLHLTAGSPCIDTAMPVDPGGLTPLAIDLDGGKRTIGPAPDMGAYEYGNVGVFGTISFAGIASNAPAQIVTIQFRPANGGAAINTSYFTTSDGGFYLYGIPDGSYNLWIKSPTYLATLVPVMVTGGVARITATLQPGDANNDNACNALDFGILVNAYGSSIAANDGYDPTADFNGDGSVDVLDFGLLVNSYGSVGVP